MDKMKNQVLRSYLLLLAASAIWGLAFVAQRVGGRYVPAFTFNAVRFILGSLSLLPLILYINRRMPDKAVGTFRDALPAGLLTGCVLFFGASFQQLGMSTVPAGEAAFITDMYIVLVPLFGLLLHQRIRALTWVSIGIALAGLYFVSVTGAFTVSRGVLYEIAGAVFWSGHILVVDRFSRRVDPLKFSMIQFMTCGVLSLAAGLAWEKATVGGLMRGAVPILYGGLLSVGVAYTLQVIGQKYAKPSHSAVILSMESLFAALGGFLILRENLGLRGYVGCGLMIAGVLLSQVSGFRSSVEDGGLSE